MMNEPNPYEPPQTADRNQSVDDVEKYAHRWNQMEPNWARVSRGAKKCLFAMGASIAGLIFTAAFYFLTDFFIDNSRGSEIGNFLLEIVLGLAIITSFILYFIAQLSGLRDLLAVGRRENSFGVFCNSLLFFCAYWISIAVGMTLGEISPLRIQNYYEFKGTNWFLLIPWICNINYQFGTLAGIAYLGTPLDDSRIRRLGVVAQIGTFAQMMAAVYCQHIYNNNRTVAKLGLADSLTKTNAIVALGVLIFLFLCTNACYAISLKIVATRAEALSRSEPPRIAPNL